VTNFRTRDKDVKDQGSSSHSSKQRKSGSPTNGATSKSNGKAKVGNGGRKSATPSRDEEDDNPNGPITPAMVPRSVQLDKMRRDQRKSHSRTGNAFSMSEEDTAVRDMHAMADAMERASRAPAAKRESEESNPAFDENHDEENDEVSETVANMGLSGDRQAGRGQIGKTVGSKERKLTPSPGSDDSRGSLQAFMGTDEARTSIQA
jgi:hypothetical protein